MSLRVPLGAAVVAVATTRTNEVDRFAKVLLGGLEIEAEELSLALVLGYLRLARERVVVVAVERHREDSGGEEEVGDDGQRDPGGSRRQRAGKAVRKHGIPRRLGRVAWPDSYLSGVRGVAIT